MAVLVLGLATTGGARSISSFTRWIAPTGYTTITYHSSTTSTTKATTTSSYHHATTTTKATTTTTTMPTTTTTKATMTTSKPKGDYGCTPGYWRQAHHYDSWAGYSPGQDYEMVFGVVDNSFTATLGQAVRFGGGGRYALARHAVAALLNSANPDVEYQFTTTEVIELVQDAYETGDFEDAKDILEDANEEGCPLS